MKLKKSEFNTFMITFIIGFVAHFFIIANPLFNADGIFYNSSFGAGSILGRWLIEILNTIFYKIGYNNVIPMLNIVISILILSFASVYLLRILDIENIYYRQIISSTLVLSPAIIQTFFYGFTAHIYSLSILLTILSIYFLVIENNFVLSVYLNCFALSIYQAYIPLMFCIYFIYFFKEINVMNNDLKKIFIKILVAFISFLLSFALYYMIFDIVNRKNSGFVFKIHGMSENVIPEFTIQSIIDDIFVCYRVTFDLIFTNNVFAHNTTIFIRNVYMILIIWTLFLYIRYVVILIISSPMYTKERVNMIIRIFIASIFILLSPIVINFMFIMTNNGIKYIDDRLSLSFIFYIIFPIVILDLSNRKFKMSTFKRYNIINKITILLSCLILVHNIWLCYGSYYNQYKIINASKAFSLELATNIKMLNGFNNDTKVLFVGSPFEKNSYFDYSYYVDAKYNLYSNFDEEYENILCEYPMIQIFKEFTALNFEEPIDLIKNNLIYSEEVRNMPIYPNDGSVKLIDNIVVIKFRNPNI